MLSLLEGNLSKLQILTLACCSCVIVCVCNI